MPKQVFIPRQLPPKKPDRCELCPLIGLIPKEDRERGKREKYYCLGIYEPMTDDDGNPFWMSAGVSGSDSPDYPRERPTT